MHKQKTFIISLKILGLIWVLGLGSSVMSELQAQTQVNSRAEWFKEARYGMFIHWGVYSGAEGVWKGEKLRYDNDYAEWIYYRNRIEKDEYLTLLDDFNWETIDAEKWVILAKKAGMKYVTLTAKHHDGFALWDSNVGTYDIGEYTQPKRDVVRELADACKKHGLKMGLYYSHWVDWEHEYGWDHTNEIYPLTDEQYDQYWQQKVIPQMRELLTNYGDLGMVWFDMWIHHSKTIVTKKQLLQLKTMIRELQPNCLVNSRLGLSVEEDPDVDFRTLGDNSFGTMKLDYPWQSPATVAHSWGYHALENQWKSSTALLKNLINNVSLNGNMMLNIGPRANGDVPFEIENRLLTIGDWLERNGEAIYGAGGFDLEKDQHDWCQITYKEDKGKHKVYLHITNWPLDQEVKLTGILSQADKIYLLADPEKALESNFEEVVTTIRLPQQQPDPLVSVIVLEYSDYPLVKNGLVAESMSNGFSLTPDNWDEASGDTFSERAERFGSIPAHVKIDENSFYTWKVYIDKPGNYSLDISYNYQGANTDGKIILNMNEKTLESSILNTKRTVGEPRNNWQVDNFKSLKMGDIQIGNLGFYTVRLEIHPPKDSKIDFQWIWLSSHGS